MFGGVGKGLEGHGIMGPEVREIFRKLRVTIMSFMKKFHNAETEKYPLNLIIKTHCNHKSLF